MFKWLADNSGTISIVFGGIAIAGAFLVLGSLSVWTLSTPMLVKLGSAIGVLFLGSAGFGGYYFGMENGIWRERDRQQAEIELCRNLDIEIAAAQQRSSASNSTNQQVSEAANLSIEDVKHVTMQASIDSLTKRVSALEGAQSTRFQNESLRELHDERMRNAMEVNIGSDSDSEDRNLLSQQSMFATPTLRNRQPAANTPLSLGVVPRHRNNTHK